MIFNPEVTLVSMNVSMEIMAGGSPARQARTTSGTGRRRSQFSRSPCSRFPNAPKAFPELGDVYVIMGELLDVLPAVAAGGGQLFPSQFGHDVDFEDLAASVFDHFGDGGALGAEAAHCLFDVAAGVVLAVGGEDAGADCELGVGAVGSGTRLHGQFVHLPQLVRLHLYLNCFTSPSHHQSYRTTYH